MLTKSGFQPRPGAFAGASAIAILAAATGIAAWARPAGADEDRSDADGREAGAGVTPRRRSPRRGHGAAGPTRPERNGGGHQCRSGRRGAPTPTPRSTPAPRRPNASSLRPWAAEPQLYDEMTPALAVLARAGADSKIQLIQSLGAIQSR